MARPVTAAEQVRLAENALAAGRFAEAVALLRSATRLDRDSPRPRLLLAYVLGQDGQWDEAVTVLRRLIERQPSNADAWFNLGNLLRKQRRFGDAVHALRRATQLRPERPEAHINLGLALAQQGKLEEAERELRASIALFPAEPDLWVNLAQVQRATRRWEDAVVTLERCIALDPAHAGYRVTRALALYEGGKSDAALETLDRLLQASTEVAEAHFIRGQILLSRKQWRQGWDDYLWRPDRLAWLASQRKASTTRPPPLADLAGRPVALVGEQGLGDTLFFLRFGPALARSCGSVHLDVQPRLAAVLAPAWAIPQPAGDEPVRVLVGDLPFILNAGAATPLPLSADERRRVKFREQLRECGPAPYIGISWQGGLPWSEHAVPGASLFKRISPVALGRALADVPGTLICLQRGPTDEDTASLGGAAQRRVHDFSQVNDDLADAMALLAELDEYIAVSNTNVHLNEGLGKRTRVLVTHPAEWRWGEEASAPAWFSQAIVYRQRQDASWDSALHKLASDLATKKGP